MCFAKTFKSETLKSEFSEGLFMKIIDKFQLLC